MSDEFDDFDEPEVPSGDSASRNQKAAQDRILKKMEKERDELRAQVNELAAAARTRNVSDAFRDAGVKDTFAEFFPSDAEATAEAVKAWAETKGLVTPQAEPEVQKPTPFPSTVGMGTLPGSAKLTEAEWSEINRKDPMRGVQLANSGQVDWSDEVLRTSQT